MRIGFLSSHDPYSRQSFSGTSYYARRALEMSDVEEFRVLGVHDRMPQSKLGKVLRVLQGRKRHKLQEPSFPESYHLGEGLDWIISLVSSELTLKLAPQLKAPVVHVTDATPSFLREFYGYDVPIEADQVEKDLISHAQFVYYSSAYMQGLAQIDFGDEMANKMRVLPFGVNLDTLPAAPHLLARPEPQDAPLELLFIGKDWHRKGGDVALQTAQELTSMGVRCHLTIIGATPPQDIDSDLVTVHAHLNKNDPRQNQVFAECLKRTHMFVLPTRADCTPMVIAEANANSIPVLVTNTGGIGTLVKNGENGYMMPREATGAEYASKIVDIISDPKAYQDLRHASFTRYQEHLNWSRWAQTLLSDLEAAL